MEFDELWMEREVLRIHMAQVREDDPNFYGQPRVPRA